MRSSVTRKGGVLNAVVNLIGAAFETVEQLVYCFETRIADQQAFLLERFRYFANEVPSRARKIGEGSHHPNGRRAKRQDAHPIDSMPDGLAVEKVSSERGGRRVNPFHLPDIFNQKAQRRLYHGAVKAGAAHRRGQRDIPQLAQQARRQRRCRPHYSFRQRQEITAQARAIHTHQHSGGLN